MTWASMPLCMVCAYYKRGGEGVACKAFPAGIPLNVLVNEEDHREPIVGDNGVQFAVAKGMEGRFQKVLRLTGWPSEENEEDREG